jgi:hypothetical protein
VESCRKNLEKFEDIKINGQKIRARVNWRDYRNACKKEFFQVVKPRHSKARIVELARPQGSNTSDPDEMAQICYDFYRELFTEPNPKAADTQQLPATIHSIPKRVIPEMNAKLTAPIEISELEHAVKLMAKEKALGPDGVTIEFFKVYWKLVSADFLAMINQSFAADSLPPAVLRGLITLLHKEGDRQPLGNYRPITLLNTTYKFFAKTLQLRLQPVLIELISPDQSAFLPMRYILDNIVLTQETINWAKVSKQPLLLLKLDFAKAFDRVSWSFLFHAMEALGFDQTFVKLTKLLFTGATASVCVNGAPTKPFSVSRGVR